MGKEKKTPVTIDQVEYFYEDLTEQQRMLFNHTADLERKIDSSKFNLDQLTVGRDAFLNLLREDLKMTTEEPMTEQ